MSSPPEMRARMVQETFSTIEALEPERRDRIFERMGQETVQAIREASPLAWVPVELDIALMEAWYAEDGAEKVRAGLRSDFVRILDQPILKPIITGARALFGRSTARVITWMPHVWSTIYRNAGTPEVIDVAPGHVELEISDLPSVILQSPDYLDTIAAVMAGFLDHAREKDGRVSLDVDQHEGSAQLLVEWTV